jgi:hypothetical protein
VRDLRAIALTLALAAGASGGDVSIPMVDGNVLHGERVEDPAVAGKGIRLKTGGITVFVPWSEMAPGAREALEKGLSPAAPPTAPPVAPGAGELPPDPAPEPVAAPEGAEATGEAPPLPDCCDPRY